jgi:hypothetical protein
MEFQNYLIILTRRGALSYAAAAAAAAAEDLLRITFFLSTEALFIMFLC